MSLLGQSKLTTTAIGAVHPQGAGGKLVEEGGEENTLVGRERRVMSVGLRLCALTVGTMTGEGRAGVQSRRRSGVE